MNLELHFSFKQFLFRIVRRLRNLPRSPMIGISLLIQRNRDHTYFLPEHHQRSVDCYPAVPT